MGELKFSNIDNTLGINNKTYTLDVRQGKGSERVFLQEIKVGLKVSVRDSILKVLQENNYIQQNFKLNIKRINRWWYSVYFANKEELNDN